MSFYSGALRFDGHRRAPELVTSGARAASSGRLDRFRGRADDVSMLLQMSCAVQPWVRFQTASYLQRPALARCRFLLCTDGVRRPATSHYALRSRPDVLPLRRLPLAIPTLFGVLVVAFLLLYIAPGDPVQAMIGEHADAETIRGCGRAPPRRPIAATIRPLRGVARGDLGRSYTTNRPIAQDMLERFPKTLQLAGAAMLLATVLGITLGVLSARKPGGWFDRLSLGIAYLGISFPVYWVGLLLILLFAVTLRVLPPSGYRRLSFFILRALALGMRSIAFLARMTRSAMLESLGADYIARRAPKGLAERRDFAKHALRNA